MTRIAGVRQLGLYIIICCLLHSCGISDMRCVRSLTMERKFQIQYPDAPLYLDYERHLLNSDLSLDLRRRGFLWKDDVEDAMIQLGLNGIEVDILG